MRILFARLRNRTAAFTHDVVMIPVAWLGAYWLRFNLEPLAPVILEQAVRMLPVVMAVQGAVFWYLGLYRGVWRFASIPDLIRILRAVVVGVALTAAVIFLLNRMEHVPRSVLPLHGLLLVILLGGPRLVYRWLKERGEQIARGETRRRALIVGGGAAGEMLVRDLRRDPARRYEPVAFVDDATDTRGREIHGIRVVAKCADIPRIVRERRIDVVLLAIPSASSAEMRRLVERCEAAGVPFRTLPRASELVHGDAVLPQLREVSIEDLLGRDPVTLDWAAITAGLEGRVILVTGGGGSIGAELCRQIARLEPARLVVVDRSEYNLYRIDAELRATYPRLAVACVLADVCDGPAVDACLAAHRPGVVFHAAAYKHVPLLEGQVREAVRNNVLGTWTVAAASGRRGVATMVLISTDKAVNPSNVMGASKRMSELLCQGLDGRHPGTRFVTVRFGNVLDSAGSVVPLFRRQIARGGPVTVTHPEVRRYFMTIPEACQLILQAACMGRGGEIFVLDMGEPIRIQYLAEQMILLSGKRPGEDVAIVYTGLRPGEKLFEELFHHEERLRPTGRDKILLAAARAVPWEELTRALERLAAACARCDEDAIRSELRRLVPEYRVGSAPVPELPAATQAANVVPIGPSRR